MHWDRPKVHEVVNGEFEADTLYGDDGCDLVSIIGIETGSDGGMYRLKSRDGGRLLGTRTARTGNEWPWELGRRFLTVKTARRAVEMRMRSRKVTR